MRIQSAHMFRYRRPLVSGVHCIVENCFVQLYVRPCHVVSAEIAVAWSVQIDNPADCEMRGFIRFLQTDEIGYLAENARFREDLFCCMTMHVRKLYCPADTSLAA